MIFKAFDGKFTPSRDNKIINDYCTSCHEHHLFVPNEHVSRVTARYKKEEFKNAGECRVCHYLKKTTFFGDIIEKTRYPK